MKNTRRVAASETAAYYDRSRVSETAAAVVAKCTKLKSEQHDVNRGGGGTPNSNGLRIPLSSKKYAMTGDVDTSSRTG